MRSVSNVGESDRTKCMKGDTSFANDTRNVKPMSTQRNGTHLPTFSHVVEASLGDRPGAVALSDGSRHDGVPVAHSPVSGIQSVSGAANSVEGTRSPLVLQHAHCLGCS